jgi:transcriptional regulator with XRE-family HTH domain
MDVGLGATVGPAVGGAGMSGNRELGRYIGRQVKAQLVSQGRYQYQLAEDLGISNETLSTKVAGSSRWSVLELYRVADILGCDITDLLPPQSDVVAGRI